GRGYESSTQAPKSQGLVASSTTIFGSATAGERALGKRSVDVAELGGTEQGLTEALQPLGSVVDRVGRLIPPGGRLQELQRPLAFLRIGRAAVTEDECLFHLSDRFAALAGQS